MGIHAIAKNAKRINQNIRLLVAEAVENVEKPLVNINRSQMLRHKLSDGRDFVNTRTGKKTLSKAYARRTNKRYPNLYESGTFQKNMFLDVNENNLTMQFSSYWDKTNYLEDQYTLKIWGIMPKNIPKARKIAVKELFRIYYKQLLGA
jgi:hypothetical protein